jgi:hypothetical protein
MTDSEQPFHDRADAQEAQASRESDEETLSRRSLYPGRRSWSCSSTSPRNPSTSHGTVCGSSSKSQVAREDRQYEPAGATVACPHCAPRGQDRSESSGSASVTNRSVMRNENP